MTSNAKFAEVAGVAPQTASGHLGWRNLQAHRAAQARGVANCSPTIAFGSPVS